MLDSLFQDRLECWTFFSMTGQNAGISLPGPAEDAGLFPPGPAEDAGLLLPGPAEESGLRIPGIQGSG